jgi:hypothetical protein
MIFFRRTMNHETDVTVESTANVLEHVHPVLRRWFLDSFDEPTLVQQRAWPLIAQRQHTLLLARSHHVWRAAG